MATEATTNEVAETESRPLLYLAEYETPVSNMSLVSASVIVPRSPIADRTRRLISS